MKYLLLLGGLMSMISCTQTEKSETKEETKTEESFVWSPESFADIKIVRYQIPGFDSLNLNQKKLVYYLTQAGLAGRDIMWDQNYRYNLEIRKAIETIFENYKGKKSGEEWDRFVTYSKRMWFSNGIHHHYSNDKFIPKFTQEYFLELLKESNATLSEAAINAMFNPLQDLKKVSQDTKTDLLLSSAINFYGPDVTQKEAKDFYASKKDAKADEPLSHGLNSKLVKENGVLKELVYSENGLYGSAIKEIIKWLTLASGVAENEAQKKALDLLIKYYQTGDLATWDAYNIAWVNATEGDIDYINSFIEVYNDPLGYKGSYESIIQINDFDASARMAVVAENAQYFETNSPVLPQHKKDKVVGISYKVVNVAGESGDASPSTPIGVNLPNADWIRKKHGSKSVSLGNISYAYEMADGPGLLSEFAFNEEEIKRSQEHGSLAGKMHTALHEVIGHASGQLEPGVKDPSTTLQNYASPLEEARADLVALYYVMDPKMIEFGLVPSLEVGMAEYDGYLRNGYMLQLRRILPGNTIEQAHMRNRQMVAKWVIEKGTAVNAVEIVKRDGKTFIHILDYNKMRELFGELLQEVQRIKSQGDYAACAKLFETYGIQVDQEIHKEVLARSEKLNIPPYGGFINPELVPVLDDAGNITDVKVEYPNDFLQQMLSYGKRYSFLKP